MLCSVGNIKTIEQLTWMHNMPEQYFARDMSLSRVSLGYATLQQILGGWWTAATTVVTLLWRHNGRYGGSNHQPQYCLLNRSFRHRSKKTSKLRVTGFVRGMHRWPVNSPAQMASNAENVSFWWRHHDRFHISDDYWAQDKWLPRGLRIWTT